MKKGMVIVVPHYDDEILQAGAFLVNYKGPIELVFTHQGDVLEVKEYYEEAEMLEKAMSRIDNLRSHKGLYEINVTTVKPEERIEKLHSVEEALRKFDVVDYF